MGPERNGGTIDTEALKMKAEQGLRQLGADWRAGKFDLVERGRRAETDVLANLPPEVISWLEQPVGAGKNKLPPILIFLGGGQIPPEPEIKSAPKAVEKKPRPSHGEAVHRRRQLAKERRKRDFDSTWLKPSRN